MRKLKTRGKAQPLTLPEKHLLLTGKCWPLKGTWRDQGESNFRAFTLISPAGRDELRALWEAHRDELMHEWTESGRKGSPWAASEFSKKRRHDHGEAES